MRKLTDLCDIQYGYAFDSSYFTEDSSYIPIVRIRDVKRGFSKTHYSSIFPVEYVIHKGDLLVGMDGEFNIAKWQSSDALLNQRVCKLTAKEGMNKEYLRYAMIKALKDLENKTSFVTVKHLTAKELNRLELNVPSVAIQNQRENTLSALEKIMHFRSKQLKSLDDLIKARFIEMFGDININNKNWHTEHLGKLCNIVRGSSPRPIEKYLGGDIPWIKIGDATDEDNIYLNSTKEHIIREGVNKSRFVKKGSLIFANCGVSLGFARIISFDGCIHDGWLALENIDYRLNKEFLLLSLNQLTDHFRIIAPSGTQPNLNIAIMQNFMQVIPPMELQETFVSFRRHVDKSREEVKKSLEKTQQLYDSLMQEYFG